MSFPVKPVCSDLKSKFWERFILDLNEQVLRSGCEYIIVSASQSWKPGIVQLPVFASTSMRPLGNGTGSGSDLLLAVMLQTSTGKKSVSGSDNKCIHYI